MTDHPAVARPTLGLTLPLVLSLALAGCDWGFSTTPDDSDDTRHFGVVATADSDSSDGAVELIELGKDELTASGGYFPTISNIAVNANGQHYYRFRRSDPETVQKVDVVNPALQQWQYATRTSGDTGLTRPYQLVFVNNNKAYLLRYGQNDAWVVNPSATNEDNFFTGETLDLSDYLPADTEGAVNMAGGVIVGDKLFIILQRLDSASEPNNSAYVAVFSTRTDSEITTGKGAGGLKGIPLNGTNPGGISYHKDLGVIVQNHGRANDPFTGTGVDVIDPDNYNVRTLVSDANVDFRITDLVVVNPDQAYTLSYTGPQDVAVQTFDPSASTPEFTTVAELSGGDYRDIELSPENTLWVADADGTNPGIQIINIGNNQILDFVATSLLPIDLAFATVTD